MKEINETITEIRDHAKYNQMEALLIAARKLVDMLEAEPGIFDRPYTTVEGHEIQIGHVYETRHGDRAFVYNIYYAQEIDPIKAVLIFKGLIEYNNTGYFTNKKETKFDLMRPYVEKRIHYKRDKDGILIAE